MIYKSPIETSEFILKEFADVFTGTGRLKRIVKIKLKENSVPHVAAPRKVPLSIHNKVKEELSNMVEAGIISKVEEPTEWVSNMVIIDSPKKLRICLDPRPLNEVVKRPHYPIPTAYALVTKLQGGHVLSDKGIKPDPKKIRAIKEFAIPNCKEDLQRFLGKITYLAKFTPHLSNLTHNLRQLLKKDSVRIWDTNTERDFELVKQAIVKSPCLKYFNGNKAVTVSVDASKNGLGAVLLQEGQPVAYGSVSLTQTQQRYAQIEKELIKEPSIRADALSRAQSTTDNFDEVLGQEATVRINLLTQASPTKWEEIASLTACNPEMQDVLFHINNGWPQKKKTKIAAQPYWHCKELYSTKEGIICRGQRIVVPVNYRKEILKLLHVSHKGIVCSKIKAREYFTGLT
ncbi:retrovirus-related Pol polyprotein from transposon 17.6 [Trichonephila clavipes]|nr:retrovirus-related Pol polyprotein from transposon 17.6 [Trichonephila clavipes]